MGWMDDDLHPRIVGEPTNYFYGTQTEVMAVPVTRNGVVDAYAFYGVNAEENAAGFVYRMSIDFPGANWYATLSESFAQGLTASEAIHALLGSTLAGGWSVGTDLARAPGKDALKAELNPPPRVAPGAGRVSPELIDAVLRGEARPTPEVNAAIANLDAAVALRPAPEPLLVAMPRTLASLPDDLQPGARVTEPTFLRTVISTRETVFPDAEAVLTLRIEPGTPAIFVENRLESVTQVRAGTGTSFRLPIR